MLNRGKLNKINKADIMHGKELLMKLEIGSCTE